MNFDATGDNIRGLLTATRSYIVPRFQRDFSWDQNNYRELLDDLLTQITFEDDPNKDSITFKTSHYYLGNMIFLGTRDRNSVEIIDGQQRLTTGTILLAAIRDSLFSISASNDDLAFNYAETTQNEYLVKKIDGTPARKLKTTSSYPYFTQTIQHYNSDEPMEPSNDEEEALKNSFDFFKRQLKQQKLLKSLLGRLDRPKLHRIEKKNEIYVASLKALRDQLLDSEIVEIFVADKNQAHRIFENINSKGKPLSQVDLIKNDIFSKIKVNDGGIDYPSYQWKDIANRLNELDTNFNEFFLHFWKSKYPSDSANGSNLYKKYNSRFKKDDDENSQLKQFVKDLAEGSRKYVNIVNPSKDDFNQQEKKPIYQALDSINKFHGIQSRVALLALFNSNIKVKQHKINNFLQFLANFHFAAFGTNLKIRSNLTTNKYKIFCQNINNAKTPQDVQNAISILEKSLLTLINKDDFKNSFTKLTFKKENSRTSMASYPASFAIKTIADKIDQRSYNDDDYTIEHVLDESGKEDILTNIGNLSVLERKNNDILSQLKPSTFTNNSLYKKDIYVKSAYSMPKQIDLNDFHIEDIPNRALELSDFFWNNCLDVTQ